MDSRVFLPQIGHRGIFSITFLLQILRSYKKNPFEKKSVEPHDRILDIFALYFLRYDLRKLGFLQALEFPLKQVIVEFSL